MRAANAKSIVEWTADYEKWLTARLPFVVVEDLEKKHDDMAESAFVFLRATYYAWAWLWPVALPELSAAPRVTGVGDLHFENFGTWRDAEGRLAWGINDFDEASVLPYTNDLVRLATSVVLAYDDQRIKTPAGELSRDFLDGYRDGLENGGQAIVLGEEHKQLRDHILQDLLRGPREKRGKDKRRKKKSKGTSAHDVPRDCQDALEAALPAGPGSIDIRPRVAGVGSLGRPRFTATRTWNGAPAVREAKARVPSAATWARRSALDGGADAFGLLLKKSIRSPDPFLHLSGNWVVRRLAADSEKMELKLKGLPRSLERELAGLMGRELANVHLVTAASAGSILTDLEQRGRRWLVDAATEMAALTTTSYKAWAKAQARQ